MIRDRLTEKYEGSFGSPEGQRITRLRIHWMCRQVAGEEVLDIGCSQGLASILLGREGRRVTGIDARQAAIAFAEERLAAEEPVVRDRVHFLLGEAQSLPFDDACFDTVLMGELLEHLIDPRPVLREARRVLRQGGSLVLTTPYGRMPSLDHKDSLYILDVRAMFDGYFAVQTIELVEKFLAFVAVPGDDEQAWDAGILQTALNVAEERLKAQDRALAELREKAAQDATLARTRADALRDKLKANAAEAKRVRVELQSRIRDLERSSRSS